MTAHNSRFGRHMARIHEIEAKAAQAQLCDTCRFWGPCARVFSIDGVIELPRGEYCPDCGRHVPISLTRTYVIVPSPDVPATVPGVPA